MWLAELLTNLETDEVLRLQSLYLSWAVFVDSAQVPSAYDRGTTSRRSRST
jgi:hypothetical protein